ncbi:MAG: 30S ribosomal protein S20 [bacterium]|nr:30S ribosomal protein S20 [bacterium]
MPILKNAKKALRASKRKASYNSVLRSKMRTAVKALQTTKTKDALSAAYSFIDRAAKRSLIHANAAGRLKRQASRLAK